MRPIWRRVMKDKGGWVQLAAAAAPYLASAGSALLGKKKKGGELVNPQPQWQSDLQSQMGGWASQYLPNYKPGAAYDGNFTAPMTGFENQGLGQLQNYMNAPGTGDLFNAGSQELQNTLSGKYADPNTSPFIQSMMAMAKQNLGDEVNRSRASAGSRGTYYTQNAQNQERLLAERTQNNVNANIGSFVNNERGRQFAAAPLAQQFDQYQNQTVPLSKIDASQSYGTLSRTVAQADLERRYTDYERQRSEMAALPGIAQGMAGMTTQDPMTAPIQDSNPLASILDIISKLNFKGMDFGGKSTGSQVTSNGVRVPSTSRPGNNMMTNLATLFGG